MIKDIIEKCKKKKAEADGSYGDLGAIPTAPGKLNTDKKNFIVDGEVVKEKDKSEK